MPTVEFITALFFEVDEQLGALPKHPEAHLWRFCRKFSFEAIEGMITRGDSE